MTEENLQELNDIRDDLFTGIPDPAKFNLDIQTITPKIKRYLQLLLIKDHTGEVNAATEMLNACKEALRMYQEVQPAGGWQSVEDNLIHVINKATEKVEETDEELELFLRLNNPKNKATEKENTTYVLSEDAINGTAINEKIANEELFEYRITDREDFIDTLFDWISEARETSKEMMKEDLKMLMNIEDEYILSSISTNKYLYVGCSEFNDTCKKLLELSKAIL